MALLAALPLGACAPARERAATDSMTLEAGAVRQPLPTGIDPRMVEWRADGVLIASRDSLAKMPGYIVDSVFPPEEAMRRFRAEISGTPPTRLVGGARTRDALLRRYWSLLVTGDTSGVSALTVSKAEFAYLYLPGSVELRAGMPPAIAWLLLEQSAAAAFTRALARASDSRSALLVGTSCRSSQTSAPEVMRVVGPCGIILQSPTHRDTVWIARRVVERDGVVKLLSFDNTL